MYYIPLKIELNPLSGYADETSTILKDTFGFTHCYDISMSVPSMLSLSKYDNLLIDNTIGLDIINDYFISSTRKLEIDLGIKDQGLFIFISDYYDKCREMFYNENELSGTISYDNVTTFKKLSSEFDNSSMDQPISGTVDIDNTISEMFISRFPQIAWTENGENIEDEYKAYVSIIVGKITKLENGLNHYEMLESFNGSLDPALDEYVGNKINQQSEYIRFIKNRLVSSKISKDEKYVTRHSTYVSYNIYEQELPSRQIYYPSLMQDLSIALSNIKNCNEYDISYIVDGGLSTIAQYCDVAKEYVESENIALNSSSDIDRWKSVCDAMISFCEHERKDCFCILDAPRHSFIYGNTLLSESQMSKNIRYMSIVNSSYAAIYGNWCKTLDKSRSEYIWLPPSTVNVSKYIESQNYITAGISYGRLPSYVLSTSTSNLNLKTYDLMYRYSINFSRNYAGKCDYVEGEKTALKKDSVLNRIHARLTMISIEKQVREILKYYVYQPNNAYVRQNMSDTLDRLLKTYVKGQLIYEYKIVCDESQNVDSNEIKVSIYVKLTRLCEYILVTFVATRSDVNFEEIISELT